MKRKGFTLIELIISIVLLAVIGLIVVLSMTNVENNNKEKEYKKYVAAITSAASTYGNLYPEQFQELYVNKAYLFITIEDLISSGLLSEDLTNPYTNKAVDPKEKIRADLDADGVITYTYPADSSAQLKEAYLLALTDQIAYGEPYSCIQGYNGDSDGRIALALADEFGNVIKLTEANIKKYNFSCKMPSNFKNYTESGVQKYIGIGSYKFPYMRTETPGTYEIEYIWTVNGVEKRMTRVIRVMPKANPLINFYQDGGLIVSNTKLGMNDTSEKLYQFEPDLTGADKNSTNFLMTVNIHSGSGADTHYGEYANSCIKNASAGACSLEYWPNANVASNYHWITAKGTYVNTWSMNKSKMFEGKVDYNIKVSVNGIHYPGYKYDAVARYTMERALNVYKNNVKVYTKKLDGNYIDATSSNLYSMTAKINIVNHSTVVPIDHYEYYLSDGKTPAASTQRTGMFAGTSGEITLDNKSECASRKMVKYDKIYVRAVNKNGYVGNWSGPFTIKLTNSLNYLLKNSPKAYTLGANNQMNLKGLVKYFPAPTDADRVFVVLSSSKDVVNSLSNEKAKHLYTALGAFESDVLLAGYGNNITGEVNLAKVSYGQQTAYHCDGSFTVWYKYGSLDFQPMKDKLAAYAAALPTLPFAGRYSNYTIMRNWAADFDGVENNVVYTGYAGFPTSSQYSKFGRNMATTKQIWLANSKQSTHEAGGEDPNNDDHYGYVYYSSSYGYTNTEGYKYGQQSYPTIPMFEVKNMAVCAGTGTYDQPYITLGAS